MSEKIPFYRYPYAASVATAEDPDYEPPEEEEAEDPDSSLEAEGPSGLSGDESDTTRRRELFRVPVAFFLAFFSGTT